jgi:hypothetical protein
LTREQKKNNVPYPFDSGAKVSGANVMIRAVVEEAAALASLALFLGMLAIWAQVLATF